MSKEKNAGKWTSVRIRTDIVEYARIAAACKRMSLSDYIGSLVVASLEADLPAEEAKNWKRERQS
jgi:hypothetical protein